jgi:hypothetical protein
MATYLGTMTVMHKLASDPAWGNAAIFAAKNLIPATKYLPVFMQLAEQQQKQQQQEGNQ